MNPYIYERECYKRLKEEYLKYGKLYFCVDFDNTLYDCHQKGYSYTDIYYMLKRWEPYSEVIIFTSRNEDEYEFIEKYLAKIGIKYIAINEDPHNLKSGRKIYANAYIDDRGGLPTMYRILNHLISDIETGKIKKKNV